MIEDLLVARRARYKRKVGLHERRAGALGLIRHVNGCRESDQHHDPGIRKDRADIAHYRIDVPRDRYRCGHHGDELRPPTPRQHQRGAGDENCEEERYHGRILNEDCGRDTADVQADATDQCRAYRAGSRRGASERPHLPCKHSDLKEFDQEQCAEMRAPRKDVTDGDNPDGEDDDRHPRANPVNEESIRLLADLPLDVVMRMSSHCRVALQLP